MKKRKKNVVKRTIQFLVNHSYFSIVWNTLPQQNKTKILEIIVSGKNVIPYEKLSSIKIMKLKPEGGIFLTKDKFYSTVKGKSIIYEEYENLKLLYTKLKMRDMSSLNDLYNGQDAILLCEIFVNRFQIINEKNMCNLRNVN